MSKKGGSMSKEDRERLAAQIVAASEGLISVPQAMKTARMHTPDRKNPSVQKRVYRQAKNLVVVNHRSIGTSVASTPLSAEQQPPIGMTQHGTDTASVSSLSEPPTNSSKETTNTATTEDANQLKRTLPVIDDASSVKKQRRTPKQKHRDDAGKRRLQLRETEAIKMATREIHTRKIMPGMTKVSQIKVVDKVNRHMGTNISSKTVSQMV